ncbi:unnamed protein product [Prorocentrum cordatum]|uniref:Derlin n=1 Tax=Prorocentrum cordatum TaxID=2364126 RepID=A0ABN9QCU1_9DINO|nr:unnamed protein product [Polarella glacialis]
MEPFREAIEAAREAYESQPPVTRWYFSISCAVSALCFSGVLTPDLLFLSWHLVIFKMQVWRVLTCFLYQGALGLPLLWHAYVSVMYCSRLEGESFRGRPADFLWMVSVFAGLLLLLSLAFEEYFLAGGLHNAILYLFSRRNPGARLSLMNVTVRAPYLPWLFATASLFMGGDFQDDLMGIAAGHVYYYFEDIYPLLPSSKGARVFATPRALALWCGQRG